MSEISFQASILKALAGAVSKLQSPDKSNSGTLLAEAFLWDTIQSYAKKKSDEAWKNLEKAKIYDIKDAGETAGETVLAKSPSFVLRCNQTNPVKRFSPQWLAAELKRTRKIPEPITLKACEDAKQPTKPNKSLAIVEIVQ
jgi:hypothetical protein